jgi:hypothetical protein
MFIHNISVLPDTDQFVGILKVDFDMDILYGVPLLLLCATHCAACVILYGVPLLLLCATHCAACVILYGVPLLLYATHCAACVILYGVPLLLCATHCAAYVIKQSKEQRYIIRQTMFNAMVNVFACIRVR